MYYLIDEPTDRDSLFIADPIQCGLCRLPLPWEVLSDPEAQPQAWERRIRAGMLLAMAYLVINITLL